MKKILPEQYAVGSVLVGWLLTLLFTGHYLAFFGMIAVMVLSGFLFWKL